MKKCFKLFLMIFLGITGICFAGAAIYGALYADLKLHGQWRGCIYCGALSVCCFIGIAKIYDTWYY